MIKFIFYFNKIKIKIKIHYLEELIRITLYKSKCIEKKFFNLQI